MLPNFVFGSGFGHSIQNKFLPQIKIDPKTGLPIVSEKKFTAKDRKGVAKSDTAVPSKWSKEKGAEVGSYPIPDRSHAANALSRVSQHGSQKEKAQVRKKVCGKYPDLPSCKD